MDTEAKIHQAELNRNFLLQRLAALDTPLEERISITKQLFPEDRKREILERADRDSKGRSVRYFRLVTYDELRAILSGKDVNGLDNEHTQESFQRQSKQIEQGLRTFLENEGIFSEFQTEFEALANNFTLQNYRTFVQSKLPRKYLFKLHIGVYGGGSFTGATGLSSLSVGAPMELPYFPRPEALNQVGTPVVEMSIPPDEVYFHPYGQNLKEMEKEVNTETIKPEWITDIYNGVDDFAARFVKDPNAVLYPGYRKKEEDHEIYDGYISSVTVWDLLQSWKQEESIKELVPTKKIEDMSPDNPSFELPLRPEH